MLSTLARCGVLQPGEDDPFHAEAIAQEDDVDVHAIDD